jgi:hypothetical protein
LNDFCEYIESKIGKGVQTGFLFYSQSKNLLYYGAGKRYPSLLKEFFNQRKPMFNMDGDANYKNEIFVVNDVEELGKEEACTSFSDIYLQANVESGFSKRLRINGSTFGSFQCYYPYKNGPTQEDIEYIREKVQPIKEELYHIRNELLDTLHELDESFFRHKKLSYP